jgi:hypothetical protein
MRHSQVAVGQDAQPLGRRHEEAGDVLAGHERRCIGHRRGGFGDDGGTPDQRADRLVLLAASLALPALVDPQDPPAEGADQERHAGGGPEDLGRDLGRDQVAERVLVGADRGRGRPAAHERRAPERLALAEEVDHATGIHHLDGSSTDHVEVVGGLARLPEDHRPRREVLDLDRAGDALQLSASSASNGGGGRGTFERPWWEPTPGPQPRSAAVSRRP